MPITVYKYIAKTFLKYVAIIYFCLAGIVMLFDIIEIIRISSKYSGTGFKTVILMGIMKNYYHFNKIWPFIILLSTIITYRKLSEDFTIFILKTSGFSTVQLTNPIIFLSIMIGIGHATILNPIGSYFLEKYQNLEVIELRGKKSLINLSESGLWLKQNVDNDFVIIHALKISTIQKTLYDFTAFYIGDDHLFTKRIDAEKAILENGRWLLSKAQITDIDHNIEYIDTIAIPTQTTFAQIIDSVSNPETLSFWQLSSFIEISQKSGFPSIKHKLYFWQLLLSPILFASIAIMAYGFSATAPRFNKSNILIFTAFFIEFIIYFISDFVNALSLSGTMPTIIATTFPIILSFIVGIYAILHYEFSN